MQAIAQLMPIPPPMPDTKMVQNVQQGKDDHKPPVIEVLTKDLKQGKNVFKVKITDASGIGLREVKFVQNGAIRIADLVKDYDNVYKTIVTVQPPSAVIVINVEDGNGNRATSGNSFNVAVTTDIFSQIWNFFKFLKLW